VQEIEHWFPLFAPCAKVIFHDTIKGGFISEKMAAWASVGQSSVIASGGKHLNRRFNEKEDFVDFVNGWSIRHYANCSG
jgi:hypothetical protein